MLLQLLEFINPNKISCSICLNIIIIKMVNKSVAFVACLIQAVSAVAPVALFHGIDDRCPQ